MQAVSHLQIVFLHGDFLPTRNMMCFMFSDYCGQGLNIDGQLKLMYNFTILQFQFILQILLQDTSHFTI